MLRLDVFLPELARDETRVLQLSYLPDAPPRPVALVEHYCDEPGCDCRRSILRAHDLQDRSVLATIAHGFDEPGDDAHHPEQTYIEPLAPDGPHAALILGVIRHLLENHDYQRHLESHYAAFKDVVERHQRAGARPEVPKDVGRNDPCPCGSGRKFKKCCLRKQKRALDDVPKRHDLSLDEFRSHWRFRAESIDQIDGFLEVVNDAQLAGDHELDIAQKVADGLHIDIDRDGLLQMLQRGECRGTIADRLADRAGGPFADCPELIAPALPGVVDTLTNHWSGGVVLPRDITAYIDSGYIMDNQGERRTAWTNWVMAWTDLTTWIEDNRSRFGDEHLLDDIDDILDTPHSLRDWIADLSTACREQAVTGERDLRAADTLPSCLEILARIEKMFADSHPVVANNAAVNRYYALLVLDRTDEATATLETLADRPTEDLFAPLFLGDVYGHWGFDPSVEALERIVEFCERTIEMAGEEASLLQEVYDELAVQLDAISAD